MTPYLLPTVAIFNVILAIIFAYPMFKYASKKGMTRSVFSTTFSFTACSTVVTYGTCAIIAGDQKELEWSAWHQISTIFIAYTCYFTEGKIYLLADKDKEYHSKLDNFMPVALITFLFACNMLLVKSIPQGALKIMMLIFSNLVYNTLKKRAFKEA